MSSHQLDAGCRLLLERCNEQTSLSLLFLHCFGASLRHTVTSKSYCLFRECNGIGEAAGVEVLKLKKVESVLENTRQKDEASEDHHTGTKWPLR